MRSKVPHTTDYDGDPSKINYISCAAVTKGSSSMGSSSKIRGRAEVSAAITSAEGRATARGSMQSWQQGQQRQQQQQGTI